MAYIAYLDPAKIAPENRVDDTDNILRIHGVNSRIMKRHFELYRDLMHRPGPLSRVQREMIAVVVSTLNNCHY